MDLFCISVGCRLVSLDETRRIFAEAMVRRGLAKDCLLVSGGCCAAEGPGDSPGTTSNRVTVYCWGRRAIIAGRCIGTARAADPLDRKRLQGLRSPGVRRPSRIRSTTSGRAPAETASARAQETGRRGEPRDPTCPSRRPVPRRRAPRTETTNNVHIEADEAALAAASAASVRG